MMDIDLEKLYSPSQWSKRFAKPEDVEIDHVKFAENGKKIDIIFSWMTILFKNAKSIFHSVYSKKLQRAFGCVKNGQLKKLNLIHDNRMRTLIFMASIYHQVSHHHCWIVIFCLCKSWFFSSRRHNIMNIMHLLYLNSDFMITLFTSCCGILCSLCVIISMHCPFCYSICLRFSTTINDHLNKIDVTMRCAKRVFR